MERRIGVLFFVLLMVVLVAAQCQQPASSTESPAGTAAPATPLRNQGTTATAATEAPAAGAALLQERCTVCHNLARVENAKKAGDEWRATVQRMAGKGAKLSPAEQESLVKYLAATYK